MQPYVAFVNTFGQAEEEQHRPEYVGEDDPLVGNERSCPAGRIMGDCRKAQCTREV